MGFTRDMDNGEQLLIKKTIHMDAGIPLSVAGNFTTVVITHLEKTGRKARISIEADDEFRLSRVTEQGSNPNAE